MPLSRDRSSLRQRRWRAQPARRGGHDLVAKSGARYRVLYLGGSSRRMTLPVLRRLAQLVEGGATIVGTAPESSPSLKDDPAIHRRGARLQHREGCRRYGGALPSSASLRRRRLLRQQSKGPLRTFRRSLPCDWEAAGDLACRRGHVRADLISKRKRLTIVPLEMLPHDAFFVVFQAPAAGSAETVRHHEVFLRHSYLPDRVRCTIRNQAKCAADPRSRECRRRRRSTRERSARGDGVEGAVSR
jgi:hypothetical protein